jgi:hypothetical protein
MCSACRDRQYPVGGIEPEASCIITRSATPCDRSDRGCAWPGSVPLRLSPRNGPRVTARDALKSVWVAGCESQPVSFSRLTHPLQRSAS